MSNAILTELIRVKRVVEVEAGEGRAAWSLWAQSSPLYLEGDASDRSLLTGWSERARVCVPAKLRNYSDGNAICVCWCHCRATRCHWAGPRLMPRLQTQLTGWESSRFLYSHVFKYLSARSPLGAPCGISSLVLQGRDPVEAWETLRRWVKKKTCLSPLVAALCIARARRTKRRSRFPARIMDALFENAFEND